MCVERVGVCVWRVCRCRVCACVYLCGDNVCVRVCECECVHVCMCV